ncbi:hypothetical protein ACFLXI_10275 [Chloroflexota bacterium]
MARRANQKQIDLAAGLIHSQPGQQSAAYAREMGCARETFNRLLVHLNDRGVLLSEDSQGQLWPFRDSTLKK